MIRDKDARRYIYKAQPSVDADRLEVILAAIRERGRNVTNRTHLHPELAHWKGVVPLPEPPIGEVFVLNKLNSIAGDVTVKYVDKMDASFIHNALQTLSRYCSMHFTVYLAPPPPPSPISRLLTASIVLEDGKIYLAAGSLWCEAFKPDPTKWLAAYQKVIKSGNLPLHVTHIKGNYEVKHTTQGEVLDYKKREGFPPAITGVTLPGLNVGEVLATFRNFIHHPKQKATSACWHLDFTKFTNRGAVDPLEGWRLFNKLGFSAKKAEAWFWWHLRDYTMFREMPLMAQSASDSAAQSFCDFEFGDGKKCQLDVLCDKKSKYHLMFSFDSPKDYAELAALLKIKLKEWE